MNKADTLQQLMDQYRNEWDLTHPSPQPGKIHAGDFLQFYLFMPVAALGPIVSAFRTYALLRDHAVLTGRGAIVEGIIGTLFFELAAIVYLMIRLRRLAREKMPEISLGWISVGLFWTIGAVTVANVVEVTVAALAKAGVIVPPAIPAAFIGFFIGLGVPLCTVVAGETIGRFLLEWQRQKQTMREEHACALGKHEASFVASWNSRKGKLLREYESSLEPSAEGKSRSSYSLWATKDERLSEILRYIRDCDIGNDGVDVENALWPAIWNGRDGSQSTRYQDIKELEESGSLEILGKSGNRRVREVRDPSAF